jgi:Polysaccharide lyase
MHRRHCALLLVALLVFTASASASSKTAQAPGQIAPIGESLPTITGVAMVGQTFFGVSGSWNGPAPSYAYQWVHCSSTGTLCAPIAKATAQNYLESSADVGYTLRLVVTATNKNGSAVGTSNPTPVVQSPTSPPPPTTTTSTSTTTTTPVTTTTGSTSTTTSSTSTTSTSTTTPSTSSTTSTTTTSTTPTTTSTTPVGTGYYYAEHFNSAFTYSFWQILSGGTTSYVSDGVSGSALRVRNCASSSATSLCSGSGSTYAQEGGIDVASLPSDDRPHTGRVPGSGTNCCDGDGAGNVDTWYRFHVRLPTGYQPTPGLQNTIWEAHVDGKTESEMNSLGNHAYSTLIGIQGQGTACPGAPQFCSTAGTQPRFFFQVPGGPTTASDSQTFKRYYPLPVNSVILNHWYDVVVHVRWSSSSTGGWFQCWLDGTKVLDVTTATLYTRQNGTRSYSQNVGLYDYRLWANWVANVDFDEMVWGPTAASVGVS